jgi:hypothetical protein
MKFIVTASKFQLKDPPRNPFFTPIEGFGKGTIIRSTLEVEADDEAHVRRLWKKAQKDGYQRGFSIEKIAQVPTPARLG